MPRDKGCYYWVIYQGSWVIAEWQDGFWYLHGGWSEFHDDEFEKIDERPICYDHEMDEPGLSISIPFKNKINFMFDFSLFEIFCGLYEGYGISLFSISSNRFFRRSLFSFQIWPMEKALDIDFLFFSKRFEFQ